jgi:hypothetical protein
VQAVPPGCSRYSISIKKPLGLVLEQNKQSGVITVVRMSAHRPVNSKKFDAAASSAITHHLVLRFEVGWS